jgi:uncharacterized protein (TIGR01777 family)
MPTFNASVFLPVSPAEAYAWHTRPGGQRRLVPGWLDDHLEVAPEVVADAAAQWSSRSWRGNRHWSFVFHDVIPSEHFGERCVGPGSIRDQRHHFIPDDEDCRLADEVVYQLPNAWTGNRTYEDHLLRIYTWRHQRALADLGRLHAFRSLPRLRVALSGASGLVGSQLAPLLSSGGHKVIPLLRPGRPAAPAGPLASSTGALPVPVTEGPETIHWDPATGIIDNTRLATCDAVVHLAGAGIGDQAWSPKRKHELYVSRVNATRQLCETLARSPRRPQVLIVASAIGFYGDRGEEVVDEDSASGLGFLAGLCRDWEAACDIARKVGIRVVNVRIGLVLSKRGGVLAKLVTPTKLGLGGKLGNGRQWCSWIAIDDLVYLIHHLLMTPTITGVVNAVAPTPVRQEDFALHLRKFLHRPALIHGVPAWAVRAGLGEMGKELLLGGARVVSRQLEQETFAFHCADLDAALRWEFGRLVEPVKYIAKT